MKKIKYFYISFLLGLFFTACELDYQPLDGLANTTNWQTEDDVRRTVNHAYRYLSNTDIQAFISCATDDSYSWSNWPSDIQFVGNGSATNSTGVFINHWVHYYKMIAACNDVTDNIDRVTAIDDAKKNGFRAEVRVIRAYAYQQLTGTYGDVPLITHIQKVDEFKPSRTAKSEVVDFLITELQDITNNNHLPKAYSDDKDKGRVTHGAALALLARIALYNERWDVAAEAAEKVINLGVYDLDPNYLSIFDGTNKNNKEVILCAQHIKNTYSNPLATWIGCPSLGGWGQVVPLQTLVDSYLCVDGKSIEESPLYDTSAPFENRDPRLKMTVIVPGSEINGLIIDITQESSIDKLGASNASFSGYYYKKYIPADIEGNWDGNSYNDIILIRYAEVLLTYAEAIVEGNTPVTSKVLEAINRVRSREGVNMPPVTTMDKAELRNIIRRERRVEFPIEDNRFFDIKRWKIAEDVLNRPAYGIFNYFDSSREDYGRNILVEDRKFNPNRDYLWPVPQNEIGLNPNLLPNNSGW